MPCLWVGRQGREGENEGERALLTERTTRKNLGAREERGDRGAWSPQSQEKTAAERGGRPASPDAPEGQVLLPLLPGSPTPAASLVPKRSDRSHVTVGLTSGGWRS